MSKELKVYSTDEVAKVCTRSHIWHHTSASGGCGGLDDDETPFQVVVNERNANFMSDS